MLLPTLTRAEHDLASARSTMDTVGLRVMADHPPGFITAMLALRHAVALEDFDHL